MTGLEILFPAFVLSLLLVTSHTYLGLHVLARGIIFVDLALAQVAALGASVALVLGHEAHGDTAFAFACGASLLAALAFAQLRRLSSKTGREVVIGSVYVVATAATVLVLSWGGPGLEELKQVLNGAILWTRWREIGVIAPVYGALAIFHLVCRRRFLALSFEEETHPKGFGWWEFLFFASFSIVITFAVEVAGVLMVFASLIIPAFSASLLTGSFGARLICGWALGIAAASSGLVLSYVSDLPTGATVVAALGVLPAIAVFWRLVRGIGVPLP